MSTVEVGLWRFSTGDPSSTEPSERGLRAGLRSRTSITSGTGRAEVLMMRILRPKANVGTESILSIDLERISASVRLVVERGRGCPVGGKTCFLWTASLERAQDHPEILFI